eukprot:5416769-Prymnesium_polylepis.1
MGVPRRTFALGGGVGAVSIEQGRVAAGSTGAAVWNAGALLANYLATGEGAPALAGAAVVELGCGAGLCGIVRRARMAL